MKKVKCLDPCCNGIPLNHSILLMVSLSNLISFHISILSIFLILMLIYIDMREIFANDLVVSISQRSK